MFTGINVPDTYSVSTFEISLIIKFLEYAIADNSLIHISAK